MIFTNQLEEIPLTHEADCILWTERTRLYLAALKGDWNSIEGMPRIQRCIGIKGETTLHIAAAAKKEEFVNKLLNWMRDKNLITAENVAENVSLTARNETGATAMNFAAAVGNVDAIARYKWRPAKLSYYGRISDETHTYGCFFRTQ